MFFHMHNENHSTTCSGLGNIDDSESCQIYELLSNTISVVWTYSGLKGDPEGCHSVKECGSPMYKVCGKVIPSKGGNTSNLITHLRDHHPEKYSETCLKVVKKACLTKGKGFQPTLCELQEHSMNDLMCCQVMSLKQSDCKSSYMEE